MDNETSNNQTYRKSALQLKREVEEKRILLEQLSKKNNPTSKTSDFCSPFYLMTESQQQQQQHQNQQSQSQQQQPENVISKSKRYHNNRRGGGRGQHHNQHHHQNVDHQKIQSTTTTTTTTDVVTTTINLKQLTDYPVLNNIRMTINEMPINCSKCHQKISPKFGVILLYCSHRFCLKCIAEYVTEERVRTSIIKCPYQFSGVKCQDVISDATKINETKPMDLMQMQTNKQQPLLSPPSLMEMYVPKPLLESVTEGVNRRGRTRGRGGKKRGGAKGDGNPYTRTQRGGGGRGKGGAGTPKLADLKDNNKSPVFMGSPKSADTQKQNTPPVKLETPPKEAIKIVEQTTKVSESPKTIDVANEVKKIQSDLLKLLLNANANANVNSDNKEPQNKLSNKQKINDLKPPLAQPPKPVQLKTNPAVVPLVVTETKPIVPLRLKATSPALIKDSILINNSWMVPSKSQFLCPICKEVCQSSDDGVLLLKCLHQLCNNCLQSKIFNQSTIHRCPIKLNNIQCTNVIPTDQIKLIVSPKLYKSVSSSDSSSRAPPEVINKKYMFCTNRPCHNRFSYTEGTDTNHLCLACHKNNCLRCKAIHDGLTCEMYERGVFTEHELKLKFSSSAIRQLLMVNDHLRCVECNLIILRKDHNRMDYNCPWCKIETRSKKGCIIS